MSGEINVLSRTQIILVEPLSGSVSIINAGPAGPGGSVGGSLWEEISGDLHPINNPETLTMTTDNGVIVNKGVLDAYIKSAIYIGNFAGDVVEWIFHLESSTINHEGFIALTRQTDPGGGSDRGLMTFQGVEGVIIYTNGGHNDPVWLGIGGNEDTTFLSPIIQDIMESEPDNGLLRNGQASFYRIGDSLRVVAKDSNGTVKHLTLGTLT